MPTPSSSGTAELGAASANTGGSSNDNKKRKSQQTQSEKAMEDEHKHDHEHEHDDDGERVGRHDEADDLDDPLAAKASAEKKKKARQSYSGTGANPSKLGRRGDPRMHRSVAARLANPELTLLDALRAGGFVFPDSDEAGNTAAEGTVTDDDGVALCQRKNQLSRRLRLARQKGRASEAGAAAAATGRMVGTAMPPLGGGGGAAQGGGAGGAGGGNKRGRKKKTERIKQPVTSEDATAMLSPEAQRQMRILLRENPHLMTSGQGEGGQPRLVVPPGSEQQGAFPNLMGGAGAGGAGASTGQVSVTDSYRRLLSMANSVDENNPPPLPGTSTGAHSTGSVAGLANSAPEVINEALYPEDDDEMQDGAGASRAGAGAAAGGAGRGMTESTRPRMAKDHPLFAQYQAALLGGAHGWTGGVGTVMAAANAAQRHATAAQNAANAVMGLQGVGTSGMAAGGYGVSGLGRMGDPWAAHAAVRAHSLVNAAAGQEPTEAGAAGKPTDGGGGAGGGSGGGGGGGRGAVPDSLAVTAATLGMSKEQLAAMLGQGGGGTGPAPAAAAEDPSSVGAAAQDSAAKDGSTAGAPPSTDGASIADEETRLTLALDYYRTEHMALLKRSLLVCGFDPSKAEESNELYLRFVVRAAGQEQKRLERLGVGVGGKDGGGRASTKKGACCGGGNGEADRTKCFEGRHVHRLEGKCGHRAIIHQPPGGQPHVDFIVDGKVECYQGSSGIKHISNEAIWPSSFTCSDISCDKDKDGSHEVTCGKARCNSECHEVTRNILPTVLELSEEDLEGQEEWKFDMFDIKDGQMDTTLLGLMQLGDDTVKESSTSPNATSDAMLESV